MDSAEFRKLIAKHFSPKIRELGWKGSGFHYRKPEENHIINIFGLQGSRWGGTIYCETAICFDFMNDLAGLTYEKSTYASCLIRKRLHPLEKSGGAWDIHNDQEKNIEEVNSIWNAFQKQGTKFYNDFADFPHPFDKIKPIDLQTSDNYKILGKYYIGNDIELASLLKEVNLLLGNKSIAKEFAEIGIAGVNELGKKLLVGRKTKSYRETERHLENKIKELTIE